MSAALVKVGHPVRCAVRGIGWLVLAAWMCLSGCSQNYYFLGQALPAGIEDRVMTLKVTDVMADIGPPQRLSSVPGGLVMAWEYWQIEQQSLGVSLSFAGADALSADWGDARVAGDFLLLTVDHEHTVVDASRLVWDNDVGDATAVQAFFALAPAVDIDDLTAPLPAHRWGEVLLLPMDGAQNTAHGPGVGQHGIEQRGTPAAAGQRALEFD